MFSPKWRWASLAAAVLGCSPALQAADSSGAASTPSQLAAAVEVAGAPIPQPADAHTGPDLTRQYLEWYRRILLPPVQAAAKGQAWESAGLKFVEDALPVWTGVEQENKAQAWTELAARGDALVKGGCDEPTVVFFAARFKVKGGRNRGEISPLYRRALDRLEADARYRKAFACIVAVNLSAMLQAPSAELNQKILNLRRAGFEEGSYSGADDALFVDQILSDYDPLRYEWDATEKLVTETKGLPEWARDTILGNIDIARGWKARGHGYADAVTKEGWKEYGEQMKKAREHLEAAWKLRPDQPYAATDMIRVAMDSGPKSAESARLWFDRAVKARFDYKIAYTTYTFSLLPRWGGTYQQMLGFGLACAATKRYETDVPREFITVVDDIGRDTHQRRGVFEIPEIARALIAVDKGYLAKTTRPEEQLTLTSNLMLDGWLGHQWDEAKKALDQLPGQKLSPNTTARMSYFGTDFNQVIGEILINTSAAREDYTKAKELEKQGRYAEASAGYTAVLKTSGNQPAVKQWIESLTKIDSNRAELEKGQWMEISPKAADPSDWTLPKTARWSVPQDGALEAAGYGEDTISRWRTPVGENYELRATFEFLNPPEEYHRLAIVLGQSDRHPDDGILCHFSAEKLPKGKVRLLRGFDVVQNPDYNVELEMKNRVRVQCWHGQLSLYVNGKAVFEKFKSLEGTPSDQDGEIGFGAYKMPRGQSFRVTEIAVRVLKTEPAAPDASEGK